MIEIGVAAIQLVPTFRGLQGHIDRELGGVDTRRAGTRAGDDYSTGFGGAAKKIAGGLAAAFAGVQIGSFLKDSVSQASDLNEVGTKMQVVFGDSNAAVQQFAAQGAKALGLSSLEAQNAAASFGVFGKSAGLAGADQADFSTGMAKLAVDMASFSNTTPEQAIEALSAGLRGESEPLRQYGVLLDDASLRQEALAMGLITTTKDALTPQQKVLASHSLILKQTSDAQGDFERTSGGLANQQRILSASWTDAKGKLGAAFLPGITAVVSGINDKLFPTLESVGTKASAAWDVLAHGDFVGFDAGIGEEDSPLVSALFHAHDVAFKVTGVLASSWRLLSTGDFQYGGGALGEEDSPLVTKLLRARNIGLSLGPAIRGAWTTLMTGDFPGFDATGVEEDSPLIRIMLSLREFGLGVFDQLRGIWDTLWGIAEKLWTPLGQIATALGDAYLTIASSGWNPFQAVVEGLLAAFQVLADVLSVTLVPALEWLGRFMADNKPVVVTLVGAFVLWRGVILGIAVGTALWTAAQWLWTAATTAANTAHLIFGTRMVATNIGVAWAIGMHYAAAISTGVWAAATWVLNTAIAVLTSPITLIIAAIAALAAGVIYAYTHFDWFKNIIQVAWDVIQNVVTFAWEKVLKPAFDGIVLAVQVMGDVFTWLWEHVISPVFNLIGDLISLWWNYWIMPIFNLAKLGVQALGATFTFLWENVIQPVFGFIRDLISLWWNYWIMPIFELAKTGIGLLGDAFSFLWNNVVTPVWDGIKSAISTAWDWIRDNVFGPMGDGINTIKGFFQDLWDKAKEVWDSVSGWFGDVAAKIKGAVTTVLSSIAQINNKIVDFTGIGERMVDPGGVGEPSRGGGGGFAEGGVVPGVDPGRRDNRLMPVRSGESFFVPEFTRAIGGASTVDAWNRAAEQGTLSDYFGPGFARGGVVDGAAAGSSAVEKIMSKVTALLKSKSDEADALASGGALGSNGMWGPTSTSGFAENTQAAKDFITQKWGITDIGGLYGGSVSGSDHPFGKALDVMIANYLSQAGIAQGTSVADWFVGNPMEFGTKYVIWRDRINQGGSWAPYSHPSGNDDTLAHRDHVHISFLTGAGGFVRGGGVGGDTAAMMGIAGGGVEQWRGLGLDVLAKVGAYKGMALTRYIDLMMNQIRTESSGNPNAINLTDRNAQNGDPSIGLLQVIGSTFRAALRGTPFENLIAAGQRDPRASLTASTLYSLGRYGSLPAAWRGVAYDTGGWIPPGGQGVNLLNRPEAVLTPTESNAYVSHAKALQDGYSGRTPTLVINLDSSDPLQVAVGQMIETGFQNGMADTAARLQTAGLQS